MSESTATPLPSSSVQPAEQKKSFRPTRAELERVAWLRWQGRFGLKTPKGQVYLIGDDTLTKIGYSNDANRRYRQLRYAGGRINRLIYAREVCWPVALENAMHHYYGAHHQAGEWFLLSPEQVEEARRIIAIWAWMDAQPGAEVGKDTKWLVWS